MITRVLSRPGAKDERGSVDSESVITSIMVVIGVIVFLVLSYLAGHDIGRQSLIAEMQKYGCEKVIGYTIK